MTGHEQAENPLRFSLSFISDVLPESDIACKAFLYMIPMERWNIFKSFRPGF
jgi:hypothetical protein